MLQFLKLVAFVCVGIGRMAAANARSAFLFVVRSSVKAASALTAFLVYSFDLVCVVCVSVISAIVERSMMLLEAAVEVAALALFLQIVCMLGLPPVVLRTHLQLFSDKLLVLLCWYGCAANTFALLFFSIISAAVVPAAVPAAVVPAVALPSKTTSKAAQAAAALLPPRLPGQTEARGSRHLHRRGTPEAPSALRATTGQRED